MIQRLKSALLLAPAILLMLVWIAISAGGAMVLSIGIPAFVAFSVAVSIAIAYCITLYASSLRKG